MAEKVYKSGRYTVVSEDRKWAGKPVLAFLVRSSVYVVPIVASILFSIWLSKRLPEPETVVQLMGWWAAIIAGSTGVLFVVDKLARRLLPLAALLQMTMVFPDRSPSRFRTAMRSGSSIKNLKAQIAAATEADRRGDAPAAAEIILQLSSALNAHDPQTRGHSERVRAYTEMLAEELGVSEEDRAKLRWSSLLHDIGKLQVSAEILNKPGKLDDDEWLEIKRHPTYGIDLAGPLAEWLGEWAGAIEDHHERFDGFGYPNGKAGEAISLGGRIVAVADAYDVMTTARSYKKPMPGSAAREELARHAGAQFDPEVVRAFLELAMGRLRWIAGPLSWLAQLPFLRFAGGVQNIGTSVGVAAAATTGAAAALAGGLIDIPNEALALPPPPQALVDYRGNPDVLSLVGDSFVVDENARRRLNVLANDNLIDGSELAIIVEPGFGTVIVNGDGTVTYVPDAGYAGTDTFTYEVTAPDGSTSTATVTITVADVNGMPVLSDDAVSVDEDGTVRIDVLANDSDAEGFAIATLAVGTAPLNGSASIDGSVIVYVPNPDFNGSDGFTYTVRDTDGELALATVTVNVVPVNDLPVVPGPGLLAVDDGASVSFDPLAGATDVDGDALAMVGFDATSAFGGTITEGSLVYTAPINASGTDRFAYRVSDGLETVPVTVRVAVNNVNYPPVFGGTPSLTVDENTPGTIDVLGTVADRDGDPITIDSIATTSTVGAVTDNGDGTVTYTPAPYWSGTDVFTVNLTDGDNVVPVLITVTVVDQNHPPVTGGPLTATTPEDTPVIVDLIGGAGDPDGDTITVAAIDGSGAVGTVVDNGDGTVTYTPPPNYGGSDAFTYQLTDGALMVSGSVNVTVAPVADAPILAPISDATIDEQTALAFTASATDADGDALVFSLDGAPAGATLGATSGIFAWTPSEAQGPGSFSFDVVVKDGTGNEDRRSVAVAVNEVNVAPSIEPVAPIVMAESSTLVVAPVASDPDLPANTLTFSVAGAPAGATIDPVTGQVTWVTSESAGPGAYTFDIVVMDDGVPNRSSSTTVNVTVFEVNQLPVLQPIGNQALNEGESRDVVLVATDADTPANTLTLSVSGAPAFATLTDNGDGTGFLRLNPGFADQGNYPITVTVTDDGTPGLDDYEDIVVSVGDVNLPPVVSDASFSVDENSVATVLVGTVAGTDPDTADTLTHVITGPNPGFVIDPASGDITVGSVALDFEVTTSYTLTVQVTDDGTPSLSDSATVTINVNDLNEAPVVANQSFAVLEESAPATVIGFIAATDEDPADSLTFTITGANPGFGIDSASGELTVGSAVLDYETTTSHTITIDVKDNGVPVLNDTATVTINVLDVLHPPVASGDGYTTDRDTALVVAAPGVLGNDSDEDGDPLTVDTTPVTSPGNGVVALGADGSFTYTPAGGFVGTDTFEYRIDDGAGGTDTALVSIVVDDGVVTEGLYLTSSGSGTEFAFGSTPEPNVNPVPDYDGDGKPGFTIDSSGGDPNENDPSKYQLWTLQPSTPLALNGPVRLELWSTVEDFEPDKDADLDLALFECAADGSDCNLLIEYHEHIDEWNMGVSDWVLRTFDLGAIDLTVVPTRRLEMKLMFGHEPVWVAMAGENPGEASRLLLNEANASPVAGNDNAVVGEDDGATPIDVLSNDVDTNLDLASVTVTGGTGAVRTGASNPVTGEVPYTAAGSFDYLAAGVPEIESFTYQVCDTSAACDSATVTVTITGVNDAPVAADDGPGAGFATDADSNFTTDKVTDNDSDIDVGDSFSVVLWDAVTAGGALVTDGGGGKADYDPNGQFDYLAEGETATDTFSYTIEDGSGAQATATVTVEITGVNEDPVVNDQSFTVDENSAPTDIVGTVAASDVDASDTLDYTITGANPGFTIDSATGAIGVGSVALDFETLPLSYTITVEATDDSPSTGSDDAVVTITVTDVRELPTANDNGPGAGFTSDEDTAFTTGNVLTNDVDPDGDPMTVVSITTGGTSGLVVNNGDGTFDYDPNGAFESLPAAATTTDSFSYTLQDSDGSNDTATVTIQITGVNDAPTAGDDPDGGDTASDFDAVSGFSHFIPASILLNDDTDPDTGDLLSVTPIGATPTANGVYFCDNSGCTYQSNLGFAGVDTFSYGISDGSGGSNTGTVTVAPGVRYITAPDAGSIRINEVLYAETGASEEFIELYNSSGSAVDISGWRIADGNWIAADCDVPCASALDYEVPGGTVLGPDEYAVIWIGSPNPPVTNSPAPVTLFALDGTSDRLQAAGDDVWVYDVEGRLVDHMSWGNGPFVNAAPSPPRWADTGNLALDGAAAGTSIAFAGGDPDDSRCWEFTESGNAFGCTGAMATFDTRPSAARAISPGASNNLPVFSSEKGSVVVNEVYAEGDETYEFIEIYNAGGSVVDLAGWTVSDGLPGYEGSLNGYGLSGLLNPGQYLVIWSGPNSGPRDAGPLAQQIHIGSGSGLLDEGGDSVVLYDAAGAFVDLVAWRWGAAPPMPTAIWVTNPTEADRLAADITTASIALTPNGVDADQAACFEGTEIGSSSCGGPATGNRTYSGLPASPGWSNSSWADLAVGMNVVGSTAPVDFEFTSSNAGPDTAYEVVTVVRVFDPIFALDMFTGGVVIPPECAIDLISFAMVCDSGDIGPGGSVTHTVTNVSPTPGIYDIQVSTSGWNVGPDRSDDTSTWTINVS